MIHQAWFTCVQGATQRRSSSTIRAAATPSTTTAACGTRDGGSEDHGGWLGPSVVSTSVLQTVMFATVSRKLAATWRSSYLSRNRGLPLALLMERSSGSLFEPVTMSHTCSSEIQRNLLPPLAKLVTLVQRVHQDHSKLSSCEYSSSTCITLQVENSN